MKCYVKWPENDRYSGPYHKAYCPFDGDYGDQVEIDDADEDYIVVPKSWTIGIDDEWTVWEGGECPVGQGATVELLFRDRRRLNCRVADSLRWNHNCNNGDIIAYRVVDDGWRDWPRDHIQPKETRGKRGMYRYAGDEYIANNFDKLGWETWSNAFQYKITGDAEPEQIPLSVIMDRSLWWLDDTNVWRAVDGWDIEAKHDQFRLSEPGYETYVSRDWFTGREYRNAEDFDDE
jgi:hypothetical protein